MVKFWSNENDIQGYQISGFGGSSTVCGNNYLTPDVNSGHETFFHAATCFA
jgi:hypothetical protein